MSLEIKYPQTYMYKQLDLPQPKAGIQLFESG